MEYLASVYLYTICGKYRSFRSEMYWISWYISVRVVPILLRFLWFCCKILELFYLCGIVILNFIIYINWPLSGLELITNTVVTSYVSFVVVTFPPSFPFLWIITIFLTRATWRVPLVEQALFTLSEDIHFVSSPPFSWYSCYSIRTSV
jgi:hypothetical protein